MHPALRLNDPTNLPNTQPKRRLFKRLLHLPGPEPAQIAIVLVREAIRMLARERAKRFRARPDLRLVSSQDRDRFLLGARNVRLLVFNFLYKKLRLLMILKRRGMDGWMGAGAGYLPLSSSTAGASRCA